MSLVPTESGEATPFDPFLLLPFGVSKSLSGIFAPVTRQVEKTIIGQATKQALPKSNILGQISNAFKSTPKKVSAGAGAAGGAVVANTIPKTTLSTATKAAITTGSIAATTGLLTLTPTGQQIAQDVGQSGTNITSFIREQGSLLSIFLIIGGAALLIGAIKK